jgi:hypothetical protein
MARAATIAATFSASVAPRLVGRRCLSTLEPQARRTLTQLWNAAKESWKESTHVPTYELIERPTWGAPSKVRYFPATGKFQIIARLTEGQPSLESASASVVPRKKPLWRDAERQNIT